MMYVLTWFCSTWEEFQKYIRFVQVVDSTTIWMRDNFFIKMKQNKWLESTLKGLEILPSTCQLFAWWISNTNLYQSILQKCYQTNAQSLENKFGYFRGIYSHHSNTFNFNSNGFNSITSSILSSFFYWVTRSMFWFTFLQS